MFHRRTKCTRRAGRASCPLTWLALLRCRTGAGRHRPERAGADFPVTHPSTLLSCFPLKHQNKKTRIKAERGPGEPSALRCQWTEAGRHRPERVGADFPVTHPSTLLSCSVTITTITLLYNSLKTGTTNKPSKTKRSSVSVVTNGLPTKCLTAYCLQMLT